MSTNPSPRPHSPQLEARSRLLSLLSVCEHELASLEALGEQPLSRIIEQLRTFHAELLVALEAIPDPPEAATARLAEDVGGS
jgi:hypothetical protein